MVRFELAVGYTRLVRFVINIDQENGHKKSATERVALSGGDGEEFD